MKNQIKKVTKDYKTITKETKKEAKIVLNEIVQQNVKCNKIDNNGNFTSKIVITREQKDKIKTLASQVLLDEIYAKYDDLSNKQLAIAVRNATNGTYSRKEWNKVSTTYGYNQDNIKVMDFFKNIGWAIKGDLTIDTNK